MANTTNFGWETPDDTDLVKDGALAMRTLGSAIDTSLVDLKGGTTGQVLAKASNTDLDYTWTAIDPLVILDAKGDLISATSADTPARLAVGTDGQVLTADSTASTGLKWATASSGGVTLLSTTTCSTGTTTVSTINQTYTDLQIVIYGLNLSTAASVNFNINGNATGIYATGIRAGNSSGGTGAAFTNTTNTGFQINQGQLIAGGNTSNAWKININNYSSTAIRKNITLVGGFDAGSEIMKYTEGGYWNNTSAISSFTLTTSTGTFSGGTILVYGVK